MWFYICVIISHIFFICCVDYVSLAKKNPINEFNFVPKIEAKYLSPHPSNMVSEVFIGNNCPGQTFKIPPIIDKDEFDDLYYLWFFDNRLAIPQTHIKAEAKNKSVIVFTIDKQFILSHFGSKIPNNFFLKPHLLEFFVSDRPYKIPESKMMEDYANKENQHQDYTYWVVNFNNDPC